MRHLRSERVVELDVPWVPEMAAPMPVLWQSEHQAVLAYHASPKAPGGPYCVVAFEGCLIATFGYPNEDALPGHPLHDKGLEWYGFYEVEASSWIDKLKAQNAVTFPDADWWPDSPFAQGGPIRHFAITFHDSTFECLARSFAGEFTDDPIQVVRRRFR
jgi:hypothetical protein